MKILKKTIWSIFILIGCQLSAQVGIGTEDPHQSAILDLTSSDKGILIPRLTDTEVTQLSSPVQGLLVFNKTFAKFQYYDGFVWLDIKVDSGISENHMIQNADGDVSVSTEENLAEKKIQFNAESERVATFSKQGLNLQKNTVIGGEEFDMASATLDVRGRIKVGEDVTNNEEAGMIRWNPTTQDLQGHDGTSWKSLFGSDQTLGYGRNMSISYPTDIDYGASNQKYNFSGIAYSGENFLHTYFNSSVDETVIVIDGPNLSQYLEFPDSDLSGSIGRLYASENWITYQSNTEILTWKLGTEYVMQNSVPLPNNNIQNRHIQLGDGRVLVINRENFQTELKLYSFDDNVNVWSNVADTIVFSELDYIQVAANSDTLLLHSYEEELIVTIDCSSDDFVILDSLTFQGDVREIDINEEVAVITSIDPNKPNEFILSFRQVDDLSIVTQELIINEFSWFVTPSSVSLAFSEDKLAVGLWGAYNNQGNKTGKVLLYDMSNFTPKKIGELLPFGDQENSEFGRKTIINNDEILINAPRYDYFSTDGGFLYKFKMN